MCKYTEIEFNTLAAKAEWPERDNPGSDFDKFFASLPVKDYYNDLNQLMPLAFKHAVIPGSFCIDTFDNFINYIRDSLWQIWQEGNTNE